MPNAATLISEALKTLPGSHLREFQGNALYSGGISKDDRKLSRKKARNICSWSLDALDGTLSGFFSHVGRIHRPYM